MSIQVDVFVSSRLYTGLFHNASSAPGKVPSTSYKTITETLAELSGPLCDLYEELRSYLLALGDDVQEKVLKYYVAFKRI